MVDSEKLEWFQESLLAWSEGNLRAFPWRTDATPYEVLIAEILLSATFAEKVVPVYLEFLDRYPDFEALSTADEDELADLLEPLGLQNRRAQALVSLGNRLRDDELPRTESELRDLPWVDRYGANALLCFGFSARRPIVDTNVVRIFNRVFEKDLSDSTKAAWEFAEEMLPEDDVRRYNLALLDFGAKICTADDPDCEGCPLSRDCCYYQAQQS